MVKESKRGFFDGYDVDLLVSSVKGVVTMKSIQEEKYDYDKFVIRLAHKLQEIQQDFNNLSDKNKNRLENDVMRTFMLKGIVGVLEYFNQWK